MDTYNNYQEFLDDLTIWGQNAFGQKTQFQPKEAFFALLQKSVLSTRQGMFSPFLYITLSAGLKREDAMLLAAAFSAGRNGEALTLTLWKSFWKDEEPGFPGTELFFKSSPLLFEREINTETQEMQLQIVPRIFLFLQGILLETPHIPGVYWYYEKEEPLPYLGMGIRLFESMKTCLSQVSGKKLVYLHGPRGSGRKLNYAYLAAQNHMGLAVINYEALQSERMLHEIQIECLLNYSMFVIELTEEEEDLTPLLYWLKNEETIFLLGSQPELPRISSFHRRYLPFGIPIQKLLEDKKLFETLTQSYGWECEKTRLDFLGRYNFLPGRMRDILELAKSYALSNGGEAITSDHLREAVLRVSSHSLDKYATKIRCVYQADDLILPKLPKQKLFHIINRIRNRKLVYEEWGFLEKSAYGNGVSMIFAGPPGTGKTMAAQVMASELGMELYRVELPAVVDKYIGETEKKLNRIFGEAEKSMAILFFDEADVLFSKRTEIKESNDKYSNMEIAFLLQKMEEYEGVSILATNYLQNFDSAFRRRISDIIDFPLPDEKLRKQMWQSMIPSKLPVSDELDFDFLAKQFEVPGSMIKNALIYASFLAAEASEPMLTMKLILKGLSHELEKSGKKLSRGEYGEYGHLF